MLERKDNLYIKQNNKGGRGTTHIGNKAGYVEISAAPLLVVRQGTVPVSPDIPPETVSF